MNSNVLPFDLARRGGMARRGAPDKVGVFQCRMIAVQCPTGAGELRLGALIADLWRRVDVMNSHILEEEARSGVFDVQ